MPIRKATRRRRDPSARDPFLPTSIAAAMNGGKGVRMGKPTRAWRVAAAGLTSAALAFPWIARSAPHDSLPLIVNGPVPAPPPRTVQLDFAEPSTPVKLPSAGGPALPIIIEQPRIPLEISGVADAPLPKRDPANPKAFELAIAKMYPPLPPIGLVMPPPAGPDGRPMTLDDLQRIAESNSPLIRQAASELTAPASGGFINLDSLLQARKRQAKALANSDPELAALEFAQIEADVLAGVRHGYFAVLAAQESMRVREAFANFAESALKAHVERVMLGQADPAEPLALRALTYQARAELVQARNRYLGAWKQLAATTGRIDLQPALLEGRIDRPLPMISFDSAHQAVMSRNSEIAAAHHSLETAQNATRRGTPLQLFNPNANARARIDLAKAREEPDRVKARLTSRLTDAFERYDNQRRVLTYYRDDIIPDRVRAYRAIAARAGLGSDRPSHSELVAAQHELAVSVSTYLQTLGDAWFAVVDIARLTQSRDLFSGGGTLSGAQPLALAQLPSCRVENAQMHWPAVMPSVDEPPTSGEVRAASGFATVPNGNVLAPNCPTTCLPRDSVLTNTGNAPVVVRVDPRPVSESLLIVPSASIEKSTKRRRFFAWPLRRDSELPAVLPSDDAAACCPPAIESPLPVLPKPAVPAPTPARPEFVPLIQLPEVPAAMSTPHANMTAPRLASPSQIAAEFAPTIHLPEIAVASVEPARAQIPVPPPVIVDGPLSLTRAPAEGHSTMAPTLAPPPNVKASLRSPAAPEFASPIGVSQELPPPVLLMSSIVAISTTEPSTAPRKNRVLMTLPPSTISPPGQPSPAVLAAIRFTTPRYRPQGTSANLTMPEATAGSTATIPPLRLPAME
jgi:cobalt-zinc-cadmium efflux system outer membrane protein